MGVPEPEFNSGSQRYLCRCGPSSSHIPFVVFNEMMIDSDFFSYHAMRCCGVVNATLMKTTSTDRSQIIFLTFWWFIFILTIISNRIPTLMKFEECRSTFTKTYSTKMNFNFIIWLICVKSQIRLDKKNFYNGAGY